MNQDQGAVEREVHIAAQPETIFAFFIDPEKMVRWNGVEAALDPRPGGIYRVNVTGTAVARGEYLTIEPYRRIVFTWGWEGEGATVPAGTSTVEVTLTPEGDGTVLRLRHFDLPQEERGPHATGWDHYLPRLAMAAAGRDPGPDAWVVAAANATG